MHTIKVRDRYFSEEFPGEGDFILDRIIDLYDTIFLPLDRPHHSDEIDEVTKKRISDEVTKRFNDELHRLSVFIETRIEYYGDLNAEPI